MQMQGQGQMMQVSKHHDASDDADYAYANANAYAGQETFDVGVQEIQDRSLFHVLWAKISKSGKRRKSFFCNNFFKIVQKLIL